MPLWNQSRRHRLGTIIAGLLIGCLFPTHMMAQESRTASHERTEADGLSAGVRPDGDSASGQATPVPGAPDLPAPAPAGDRRISFTAGADVTTAYLFRGILQEREGVIVPPFAEFGVNAYTGTGGVRSLDIAAGWWNSLHSGPTGRQGPASAWYEADFYTTFTLALAGGWEPGATYTAYTSPNGAFSTVNELALTLGYDDSRLGGFAMSPTALVAFELDGQADGGHHRGVYLELGVEPGATLIESERYPVSLAFPMKLGLSLKNYHEGPQGDHTFGFFSAGLTGSTPLAFMPAGLGSWTAQAGVSVLFLGDSLAALNHGNAVKPIGTFGIRFSY
jgi:hypothetical protein